MSYDRTSRLQAYQAISAARNHAARETSNDGYSLDEFNKAMSDGAALLDEPSNAYANAFPIKISSADVQLKSAN